MQKTLQPQTYKPVKYRACSNCIHATKNPYEYAFRCDNPDRIALQPAMFDRYVNATNICRVYEAIPLEYE